ncbi:MAG: precorrin-2 dehydrogenase/sirohydrochlorin ferrochelatase family protein [Gemmatimonadaceae bacterium]
MSLYPVMLHGEAIDAVVVGGGAVAARKARALLDAGARVQVVAPEQCADLRQWAAAEPRLTLTARPFDDADLSGANLVVAATDDRAVNAAVGRAARRAGLLVNVADAPDEGTFVTAAVHRAGALVVAVGAGGVPSAAVGVRDLIARRLDVRYADAVALLGGLRARMMARGDVAGWRRAAAELTGDDFGDLVESGRLAERARRWA